MKVKEIRTLLGFNQKQFAAIMNEITPCTPTDLSRMENGTMEKYLTIEHRANVLLDEAIRDGRVQVKNARRFCGNDRVLDCLREELTENYTLDYRRALLICGLDDTECNRREVRRYMLILRNEMPIIDGERGGWRLCRTAAEIHSAISKIEQYKRSKSQEEYTLYRALKEMGAEQ